MAMRSTPSELTLKAVQKGFGERCSLPNEIWGKPPEKAFNEAAMISKTTNLADMATRSIAETRLMKKVQDLG